MFGSPIMLDDVAKNLGITVPRGWHIEASIIPEPLFSEHNQHDYSYSSTDRRSYGTKWCFGIAAVVLKTDDDRVFISHFSDLMGFGSRSLVSYRGLNNKPLVDALVIKLIQLAQAKLAKMQAVRIDIADNTGKPMGNKPQPRVRNTRKARERAPVAGT